MKLAIAIVLACAGTAAAAPCNPDGTYQLRFPTNGTEGWWMTWKVTGDRVDAVGGALNMLGLVPGAIAAHVDRDACWVTFATSNEQAHDLRITLAIDAAGAVRGMVTRHEIGRAQV